MRERAVFLTNGSGATGYPHIIDWSCANFTPHMKSNSERIKDLLFYSYNYKMLRRNIGLNLQDLGLSHGFLDMTVKAERNRDKPDITKTVNFCALTGTLRK